MATNVICGVNQKTQRGSPMHNVTKSLTKTTLGLATASLLAFAGAATAQASLIGDDVTLSYFAGGSTAGAGTPLNATVDGGSVEFTLFNLAFNFDESSIFISNTTTGTVRFPYPSAERFEFGDLEWRDAMGAIDPTGIITGLTVNATNVDLDAAPPPGSPAFSSANVTFTDHVITLDMAGYVFDGGTTIEILIQTSHDDDSVPEPTAIGLFGVGLIALGTAIRRRRR